MAKKRAGKTPPSKARGKKTSGKPPRARAAKAEKTKKSRRSAGGKTARKAKTKAGSQSARVTLVGGPKAKRAAERKKLLQPRKPRRLRKRPHGVRSPRPTTAPRRFPLAAIDAEQRPAVEALLARVYRQAAAELRDQEIEEAGRQAEDAASRDARFARARAELMRTLKAWEQRRDAPPTTTPPER